MKPSDSNSVHYRNCSICEAICGIEIKQRADGTLDMERFESWRKLERELVRLAEKQDARARSESRRERARFARSLRKSSY